MKRHPIHRDLYVMRTGAIWRLFAFGVRRMKLHRHVDGYWQFRYNGKSLKAHRVICEAWHGLAPFPGAFVRHLDDNKNNHDPMNYAWGTHHDNVTDSQRNGTFKRGQHGFSNIIAQLYN